MRIPASLALILAVSLLSACKSGTEQQAHSRSGLGTRLTLTANLGGEPVTLDPNLSYGVPEHRVIMNIFEPLVRLDTDMLPLPGVAESWEHSDDYSVWTFHLRDNAVWSNGDAVTSGDFVYAIRRILTPQTQAKYALMAYSFLKGGEEFYTSGGSDPSVLGLSTPDDRTLVIELENPTPYLISLVNHTSWYPLHRKSVESGGTTWWRNSETLVTNGAFRLKEFLPKEKIVIEKSENYWDHDSVKLEGATFRFIENEPTEIAAFESGDLDITNSIPNREAQELLKRPDADVQPLLGIYYFVFNVTRPPFDDLALRRAFSLVVNRNLIVERITRRGEPPAEGFVPRGMILADGRDYRDVAGSLVDQRPLEERVAEAKSLLREAGYSASNPLPRATYLYNTMEAHADIAEVLQNLWKRELGAEVRLENVEWGVYLDRGSKHEFDLKRGGWIGDYLDPLTFLDTFEPGSELNNSGYANAEFKELLGKARRESDPEVRLSHLIEAERLLVQEDVVVVPLYDYVQAILVRDGLEGVVFSPLNGLDLKQARWVR